jgi:hypothetical protein
MAKHIQTRGRFTGRPDPTTNLFSQVNNPEIKFESSSKKLSLVATEFGHTFRLDVHLDGKITVNASVTLEGQTTQTTNQLAAYPTFESGYLTVRCFDLVKDHNRWFVSTFKTKM